MLKNRGGVILNYNFSVLMAVYYKESPQFFDMALKSNLIEQTLLPDEFVLICDGKLTQPLEEVIDKYQKLFPDIFRVYRLEENVGLGRALNFGIEKCSNEWIARADSDDICVETRFEKQIDYIKNNSVDFLSSHIYEFNDDFTKPVTKKTVPVTHDAIVKMAKSRNPLNHMAVMYKKSAVLDAGSYVHLPYTEDFYLWLRAMVKGYKFGNVDDYLVNARVGNGMVNRRGNKEHLWAWKVQCDFMLENKMINRYEYCKSIFFERLFIYMPSSLRNIVYKKMLREKV